MGYHEDEPLLEGPAQGYPVDDVIWQGTTWDALPTLCMPLAPVLCLTRTYKITSQRIDFSHGCCGMSEDTIDLRRVEDIHYHTSIVDCMVGRGTITICSTHDDFPELRISLFGAHGVYGQLKEAWSRARIGSVLDHQSHHGY
eukprot:TRINITY_DN20928_c0_g1_i1.p1 TRINITY_DN20928_c0_g1~~TRINITY_DN20928_c0_g1_i1.p1  ORF type:complete len:162 (-),score=3.47 TRINITY_DN20928_c0_g1_i1:496-921(-)